MATLNVNGQRVSIDDGFLSLSPDEQNRTVDEIAASLGSAPQAQKPAPASDMQGPADPRSWLQRQASDAGLAVHDISRLAANGAMFGYADKLAALARGTSVAQERTLTQESADRAGLAGDVAGIAGSVAAIPSRGLGLLRNVPEAWKGLTGLGARTVAAGGEGAALGALAATGHDTDVVTGALLGGAFGAGGNLAAEGIGALANSRLAGRSTQPAPVPELPEIRQAAKDAYARSEAAGVVVKPESVSALRQSIADDLGQLGWHPELTSGPMAVLKTLDGYDGQNVTLKGLDTVRKVAGNLAKSSEPFDRELGRRMVDKIDNHLDNLGLTDVLTGNKTEGVRALQDARKSWSILRKGEIIDKALEDAALQAGSTGSGGNINNAIRQQIKNILKNPNRSRGFTADEKAAMREVAIGGPIDNALRLASKMAPQGNGLMLTVQLLGGVASGGATLPLAVAGSAAKSIADKATSNNVYALARLIRSGGDASKMQPIRTAVQRLPPAEREALGRILTSWGVNASPGLVSQ